MARSPAHQFGQIIGDALEAAIEPILTRFAAEHGLYLDKKGQRASRSGRKVSWKDMNENVHDLDFVLERGGTHDKQGIPVAFIETAWRRYTKHSRNKAQEIQGAIMPLMETYSKQRPFMGAILAGVFTQGAISQLRSLGFIVAYFPYDKIVKAFKTAGIDADFDEDTSDGKLVRQVALWNEVSPRDKIRLFRRLVAFNKEQLDQLMLALKRSVERRIRAIRVLPLHGSSVECLTLDEALAFVKEYGEGHQVFSLVRYEIQVLFLNEDKVVGEFGSRADALSFLESFRLSNEKAKN